MINISQIRINEIVDLIHDALCRYKLESTDLLIVESIPLKVMKEIYRIFNVDNKYPRLLDKDEFESIKSNVFFHGTPKERRKYWIEDIQKDEFVCHLNNITYPDRIGAKLRFGYGYYFSDNIMYITNYLSKCHHKCVFKNDVEDYLVAAKFKMNSKIIDIKEIKEKISSIFPEIENQHQIKIHCNNSFEEKKIISSFLFNHPHHQSLAATLLGFDGIKVYRTESKKSDIPLPRMEYVITNREILELYIPKH